MSTTESGPSNSEPRRSRRRGLVVLLERAGEMLMALLVVMVFFAVFLGILTASFPRGTGLRDLVVTSAAVVQEDGPREVVGEAITALVSHVRRSAKTKTASTIAWSAARPGDQLEDGDALQTYAQSNAVVQIGKRSELDVGENSLIVIRSSEKPSEAAPELTTRESAVTLVSGELRSSFSPTDTLPIAVLAGGQGTVIRPRVGDRSAIKLSVDAQQRSLVVVHQGSIAVQTNQGALVLGPRQFVTIAPDGKCSAVGVAPPAPEVSSPAHGETFTRKKAKGEVRFAWTAPEPGTVHRLEVALDPRFRQVVHEQRLPGTEFKHGNLKAGRYYWRVSTLRDQVEGPPSRVREFVVAQDADPPRLEIDAPAGPVPGSTVVLQGRTEPGCAVYVGGEKVATKDQGEFELNLTLKPGTNLVVVEAVDGAGNIAYRSLYITAKF